MESTVMNAARLWMFRELAARTVYQREEYPGNGCIIQSDSTRKVHCNSRGEVKWKRLKRNFKRIFKAHYSVATLTVNTIYELISRFRFPCSTFAT
ncbi:hypothetical protein K0M31_005223, partial [Melipona bicolor]